MTPWKNRDDHAPFWHGFAFLKFANQEAQRTNSALANKFKTRQIATNLLALVTPQKLATA
jgi:hypothetical protein